MRQQRLLYFVKYPEPGRVKTRLAKTIGDQKAASLYQKLAESNLKEISSCRDINLTILFDPPSREQEMKSWLSGNYAYLAQRGNGLGERLTNAFENAFRQGAQRVVALGSDTLDLQAGLIAEAFRLLLASDVVLGPSKDGGYYLIGLSRFEPALFQNIPWSTPLVSETTLVRIRERELSYSVLAELDDLDDATALNQRKGDLYEILK